MKKYLISSLFILVTIGIVSAQFPKYQTVDSLSAAHLNWQNLSLDNDKIVGVATEQAYLNLLASMSPKKTIVVAVIDSGVDTEHEDLKGKIWTNKKEIPGNGIDDDGNGYIDDIHGWNFLGGDSLNVGYENMEETRFIRDFEAEYEQIRDIEQLKDEESKRGYRMYQRAKQKHKEQFEEASQAYTNLNNLMSSYNGSLDLMQKLLGKKDFTQEELLKFDAPDQASQRAKQVVYLTMVGTLDINGIKGALDHYKNMLDYHLNKEFNPREIVGDNPYDFNDKKYGNNNVRGSHAEHGTFVASLIAANRNNGIGINGIAERVEIMCLRAVPDGDERDKDISLAIRYAVDNGANIINMSFGKTLSPNKKEVDEAMLYAASKNVLLVHAAGNDAKNNDHFKFFPHAITANKETISTWLEVGANYKELDKKTLIGSFSNYGKESVDLFAPGVQVIGCVPDNKYAQLDGTSFASPVAAGVAALVWSYYPDLTAIELKEILMESVTDLAKKKVKRPSDVGDSKKERMSDISVTGGIINVYNALELAAKKSS